MTTPIMQGIKDEGVDVRIIKLRATPKSIAVKEFWTARGCLLGSPTLNNGLFPSVAEFLSYLKGLRPQNRMVGAFGSYGWGGGAVKEIYDTFTQMRLEVVKPGVQVIYRPSTEEKKLCCEFGQEFAKKVKSYHGKF